MSKLRQYNLKLTEEQIAFLKGLPNASEWIRKAINEKMLKEHKSIFSILQRMEQVSSKIIELKQNMLYQIAKENIEILENANEYPIIAYFLTPKRIKAKITTPKEKKTCLEKSKAIVKSFERNIRKLWKEHLELEELLTKV
jgi:hypothetical protein